MTNFSTASGIVEFSKNERIYMNNIENWERIMKDFKINERLLSTFKEGDNKNKDLSF
jgi:hypothetical protein